MYSVYTFTLAYTIYTYFLAFDKVHRQRWFNLLSLRAPFSGVRTVANTHTQTTTLEKLSIPPSLHAEKPCIIMYEYVCVCACVKLVGRAQISAQNIAHCGRYARRNSKVSPIVFGTATEIRIEAFSSIEYIYTYMHRGLVVCWMPSYRHEYNPMIAMASVVYDECCCLGASSAVCQNCKEIRYNIYSAWSSGQTAHEARVRSQVWPKIRKCLCGRGRARDVEQ